MVTVLASRDFIEKIFYQFNFYTVADFESDPKIDIESYLFFKNIIKGNKTNLHIDISEDKLLQLKSNLNIAEEDSALCNFLSNYRDNKINCNPELYCKLKNQDYTHISTTQLPCFLLLDNVSEEICMKIESAVGLNCFSLQRMTVPKAYRSVTLINIHDTKAALFAELNKFPYNELEIYDSYFLDNSSAKEDCTKNLEFVSNIKENKQSSIQLKIHADLIEKAPLDEFDKRSRIFMLHAEKYNENKNCKVEVEFTKNAKHDRAVLTNSTINLIGNSLNKNTATSISIFPKIIYSNFKF